MTTVDFLKPRLSGSRFEGHSIPLEFLKDLAVLEELIVEVARWKYLEDHPQRRRAPRGFITGVELRLTGVSDGSAVPLISLIAHGGTDTGAMFPPSNQAYFEDARDAVIDAIAAAEENRSITELPAQALSYFDRIGRSLRQGESIEFTRPGIPKPVRLTKETRRRLVLASTTSELTEEWSGRGSIPEVDQDDMTFEVQLLDGRKIRAPMAVEHTKTILEAMVGYRSGTHVFVQGVARFDRNQRLQGLDAVEYIDILDPQDIAVRMHQLRELSDGWLEGSGVAPSKEGVDWLAQVLEADLPDELPLPYLYPTPEGGIQAEWSIGDHSISLEIDVSLHRAEWHELNLQSGSEQSRQLDLDESADWLWIAGRLSWFGEAA